MSVVWGIGGRNEERVTECGGGSRFKGHLDQPAGLVHRWRRARYTAACRAPTEVGLAGGIAWVGGWCCANPEFNL